MRPRFLIIALLIWLCRLAAASDAQYFTISLRGTRLGYVSVSEDQGSFQNRTLHRSLTEFSLGDEMTIRELEYDEDDGRPVHIEYDTSAKGEKDHGVIDFADGAFAWSETKNRAASQGKGQIPDGPRWMSSFVPHLKQGDVKRGDTLSYRSFDSATHTISTGSATNHGPKRVAINGDMVDATWYTFDAGGRPVEVFESADGTLLRCDLSDVMQLIATRKEVATAPLGSSLQELVSTMAITSKIDGIGTVSDLSDLKLQILDNPISDFPSDDHQTANKITGGWIVHTHPVGSASNPPCSIARAASLEPEMTKPEPFIPASDPGLVALARKIVGKLDDVFTAGRAIQEYVRKTITYDGSNLLGPRRDALQILASQRGVCTDYSVLTVALMRAAGIPARVVVGLVSFDGQEDRFFSHAWVSMFDGVQWIDLDPQCDEPQVTAAYIEVGFGTDHLEAPARLLTAKFKVIAAVHSGAGDELTPRQTAKPD